MARSRYRFGDPGQPHFLTCTTNNWTPLFTRPETVEILLESIRFLQREAGLRLYGYVVLENHFHWIAQSQNLAKDVHRLKTFTAKKIVSHLEDNGISVALRQLAYRKRPDKKESNYQVWQEGSHPQAIQNAPMLRQKLEYIHMNPVKRGYVDSPTCWRYSSARNYAAKVGLIDVYQDWTG